MPDPQRGTRDIWVVALANGGVTRITSHPAGDWFPVWSPNGSEVLFASDRNETTSFYRVPASGGGGDQLVFRSPSAEAVYPTDWSHDGRAVVFHSYPRGDVRLLSLSTPATPAPLVDSPFTDWTATFSPDGRWIAYVSDESGTEEVYVKAVSGPERYRVSAGGGIQARWRRDGRELFYLSASDKLMSVAIGAAGTFTTETPQPLFSGCRGERDRDMRSAFMYRYDVAADGNRSLWICASDDAASTVAVHALAALTAQ
jgi:Tol biopolymer transport system component